VGGSSQGATMIEFYIYGLIDPRDDTIRYIGKARDIPGRMGLK
jgi:hypothetical protein